jgi:L-amino acid N-acyltransferase YncA
MTTDNTHRPAISDDAVVSIAKIDDIPDIIALQAENHISRGGALSIEFPATWFERAVTDLPVVIARRDGRLVGFLVSSSRVATSSVPLSQLKYAAYPASPDAYNSGPICVAASERGRGLVSKLFDAQRSLLPHREATAFIRQDNAASRSVHSRHGFREVASFSDGGVEYVVVARGVDN